MIVERGVLHDNNVHSEVNINKTIGSIIPVPGIEVDKTADIKAGQAPQNVTYTFRVYNRTAAARDARQRDVDRQPVPQRRRPGGR